MVVISGPSEFNALPVCCHSQAMMLMKITIGDVNPHFG
jgi:hypothetical protein